MSHVKDRDERWAMALLQQIIDRSIEDRDALSGEAVKHVKIAKRILAKRQEHKKKKPRRQSPVD